MAAIVEAMLAEGTEHLGSPAPTRTIHAHALIDGLGAGGAELVLTEFAAVAESVGITLTVGYLQNRDGNPVAAHRLARLGVEAELVPVEHLLAPDDLRRVRRHLTRVGPDVLHTHMDSADCLGGLAARSLGLPSLSTLHAMEWQRGAGRQRLRARLTAGVRRRCAARVVAVSDAARDLYLAEGWERPERMVTLRNGVAGRARPGAGGAVRERLGIASDALVVATLSTLRPEKGHEVAVEALQRLQGRFGGLRLLIIGDGPLHAEVQALAARLGERAIMVGYQDDVMPFLDATDVLVHPSHYDAFPTALLEAMAASVPVVASAVGGIPEIVADGHTGTLIAAPPEAGALAVAVGDLLHDPRRRSELGSAGRRRFERDFSAAAWARRTRSLYEDVLGERRTRSRDEDRLEAP